MLYLRLILLARLFDKYRVVARSDEQNFREDCSVSMSKYHGIRRQSLPPGHLRPDTNSSSATLLTRTKASEGELTRHNILIADTWQQKSSESLVGDFSAV